jgi:hypothetical protein
MSLVTREGCRSRLAGSGRVYDNPRQLATGLPGCSGAPRDVNLRFFRLTLAPMEPSTVKYFEMRTDRGILGTDFIKRTELNWLPNQF